MGNLVHRLATALLSIIRRFTGQSPVKAEGRLKVELFYRNLFMPVHKTRWGQRRYISSQQPHGIPLAWAEAAEADLPEADYPLATAGVLFLQSAREKFFGFVQALKANPAQPFTAVVLHEAFAAQPLHFQEELLELAGVCAYDNPAAAYWYGQEPAKPEDELVAFYGVKVADLAPEQKEGGVIAAVIKEYHRSTPQAFLDKFCGGVAPPSPHVPPEGVA